MTGIIFCVSCFTSFAAESEPNNSQITITNLNTGETEAVSDVDIKTEYGENGEITKTIEAEIQLDTPKTRSSVTDAGKCVRITFVVNAENSGSLYRMTGFNAKYELLDPAFTISSRYIQVTNKDFYGEMNPDAYIYKYYPTGNSYSKTFSNLNWVDSNLSPCMVGGYAQCNISRGGSSWLLRCTDWVVYKDLV